MPKREYEETQQYSPFKLYIEHRTSLNLHQVGSAIEDGFGKLIYLNQGSRSFNGKYRTFFTFKNTELFYESIGKLLWIGGDTYPMRPTRHKGQLDRLRVKYFPDLKTPSFHEIVEQCLKDYMASISPNIWCREDFFAYCRWRYPEREENLRSFFSGCNATTKMVRMVDPQEISDIKKRNCYNHLLSDIDNRDLSL